MSGQIHGPGSITTLIEWPRQASADYVFKAADAKPSSEAVAYAVAIGVRVDGRTMTDWEIDTVPDVVVLDAETGRLRWMAADERVGRE